MKSALHVCVCILTLVMSATPLHALVSRSDIAVDRQFRRATAVFEGTVVARESFLSQRGSIRTRFSVRVDQPYKGRLPAVLAVTLPGGVVGNREESVGCQPNLQVGDGRLFILSRDRDGWLVPSEGCASTFRIGAAGTLPTRNAIQALSLTSVDSGGDVKDQTTLGLLSGDGIIGVQSLFSSATNISTGSGGLGARFLSPDQAKPIPYLVDADALPTGISLNDALNAVTNALSSWTAVSSVEFSYQGIQSFGQAATDDFPGPDGFLRIQLHDLHGAITGGSTLGIGGRWSSSAVVGSDWTTGGQVSGNDFHRSNEGHVILKHTKSQMEVLSTFEEVLCHEIGHALGMAHSTPDTPAAPGTAAYEAALYYIAHEDGRGAAPTSWDANVIQQIHPSFNTPPYMFDRVMEIVTDSPQPIVPGINELELRGYDLQSAITAAATADASANNGVWSPSGTDLEYTANAVFDQGTGFDPSGNSFYEIIYARCSDGVHQSPYTRIRVLTYRSDSYPATSDGIPDYWMTDFFGNPSGATAAADDDLDTLTNIDEYRSGMTPTLASSAQLVSAAPNGTVSWQGKAYELYELQGSTNLMNWFFVKALLPTNDTPTVLVDPATYDSVVYRAFKVP